jgi:hypothetical protein
MDEARRRKTQDGRSHATVTLPPSIVPLSILLLGDTSRPEFHEARACLDQWGAVQSFSDVDSAATALTENHISPDVLVIAQAVPGQFSHEAIDRLRQLAPLARVLGLMGSWCEGEMRSGSPWPAVVRTYWHQWPSRCNRQFCRLTTGQSCSWALPSTATEEERLLLDATESRPKDRGSCFSADRRSCISITQTDTKPCHGVVAISSQSFESAEWLSAALRSRDFSTVWQRDSVFVRVEGATIGIFDGTDLVGDEYDHLQQFVVALRPAPVFVMLSFPRTEDRRRALSAGVSVVLSKPLMLDDLWEHLV